MYQLGEQIVIYIIRMFFPCGSLKLQIRELHHVNWGILIERYCMGV